MARASTVTTRDTARASTATTRGTAKASTATTRARTTDDDGADIDESRERDQNGIAGIDRRGCPSESSPIRTAFRRQATLCRDLGSGFTAKLLDLLADRLRLDTEVGDAILNWRGNPVDDALALRLVAALHALALDDRSSDLIDAYPPNPAVEDDKLWQAVEHALNDRSKTVIRFIQHPPQTNEVARSAALAGGFLSIAASTSRPLAIFEIGASAGLNLHWDKFGYDLGGLGIRTTTGLPLLQPAWEGPSPPAADITVVERAGCDRTPIDIRSPAELLRLRAYIWPDQPDRRARMDQAIQVARSSAVRVESADAAAWTEARLSPRRDGIATVLVHSIVWQYLGENSQERLRRTIDQAGRRADASAPFAWLRMEPETPAAAALRLTLWPGGDTMFLADVDYHGRWVRWRTEAKTPRSS
ncbi:MAG: DUF2332 domain-containing protein [Geminicoccaceae bacterium]